MKEHTQEVVKNGADGIAGATILLAWMEALIPILNVAGLILAIIWGVYRIYDIKLAHKIKQETLRQLKDKDKS